MDKIDQCLFRLKLKQDIQDASYSLISKGVMDS